MDGAKNVMQLRLQPTQDEKPIFCHDFFVIEVGAHHIYEDTGLVTIIIIEVSYV